MDTAQSNNNVIHFTLDADSVDPVINFKNKIADTETIKEIVGYDPAIEILPNQDRYLNHNQHRVTIYNHGFGGYKDNFRNSPGTKNYF